MLVALIFIPATAVVDEALMTRRLASILEQPGGEKKWLERGCWRWQGVAVLVTLSAWHDRD